MKTQRQKFEAFMKDILEYADFRKKGGNYICPHMQNDWGLWQAAIESVFVELPKNGPAVFLNDYAEGVVAGADIYKAAVEQALDKVGIKYE